MNGVISIRSRRLLDEQDRFKVVPASDQDAPGRIPVEVLRSQMSLFGMHCRINNYGYPRVAVMQLRAKGISLSRKAVPLKECVKPTPKPPKPKPKSIAERLAEAEARGMTTIGAMAREMKVSQTTLWRFVGRARISPMMIGSHAMYWRDDLSKYSREPKHGVRVLLPDGRSFASLHACAIAHGIHLSTLLYRLRSLRQGVTGEAIAKALDWNQYGRRARKRVAA